MRPCSTVVGISCASPDSSPFSVMYSHLQTHLGCMKCSSEVTLSHPRFALMQLIAQGAGPRAASPRSTPTVRGETQPGKRQAEAGLCPACAESCCRAEGLRDTVCSTGTAQPQGQREGQVSLSSQSSSLALPRTRGGRASSWVPNPLCPQSTRWMLTFPKEQPLSRRPPSRWESQMWL